MRGLTFNGKEIRNPLYAFFALIFLAAGAVGCLLVQPLFWLLNLRGPVFWKDGAVNFNTDGSFSRIK